MTVSGIFAGMIGTIIVLLLLLIAISIYGYKKRNKEEVADEIFGVAVMAGLLKQGKISQQEYDDFFNKHSEVYKGVKGAPFDKAEKGKATGFDKEIGAQVLKKGKRRIHKFLPPSLHK